MAAAGQVVLFERRSPLPGLYSRLRDHARAGGRIEPSEFPAAGIQVLNGRYGPYITDGKKNGKIPKDREPASLTLEECQAMSGAG